MFAAFALITLLGAFLVLWMRNVVLAGLSLVLCFIGISGLFLLLANPVAAALQVIVYSGAIVVLLLFVIMLLNEHKEEIHKKEHRVQKVMATALLILLSAGATWLIWSSKVLSTLNATTQAVSRMDLERMGGVLFKQHLLSFEVAGLLLLAAMVAAVTLVKREL